jgi:hypothetical protein
MNGNDSRFSYGLSKGKESIDTWILPESQIVVVDDQPASFAEVKTEQTTSIYDTKSGETMESQISTTSEAVVGEKRKLTETIIPNTFKKIKSEERDCQNGMYRYFG